MSKKLTRKQKIILSKLDNLQLACNKHLHTINNCDRKIEVLSDFSNIVDGYNDLVQALLER